MIFNRHGFKGYSQNNIGFELGLTIHPTASGRLRLPKAVISETPPRAGYGTRINEERYSLNSFFRKRRIPLLSNYMPLESLEDPINFAAKMLEEQKDVMVLYDIGIVKVRDKHNGHASLIEKVEAEDVVLVDPAKKGGKRRLVKKDVLLEAIKYHGTEKGAGFYVFKEHSWNLFDDAGSVFYEASKSVKSLGKWRANEKHR